MVVPLSSSLVTHLAHTPSSLSCPSPAHAVFQFTPEICEGRGFAIFSAACEHWCCFLIWPWFSSISPVTAVRYVQVAEKYVRANDNITFEGIPTEQGIQQLLFSLPRCLRLTCSSSTIKVDYIEENMEREHLTVMAFAVGNIFFVSSVSQQCHGRRLAVLRCCSFHNAATTVPRDCLWYSEGHGLRGIYLGALPVSERKKWLDTALSETKPPFSYTAPTRHSPALLARC